MRTNAQLKSAARRRLGRGGWFFRLLAVLLSLNLIAQLVGMLLGDAFEKHGITTWLDFFQTRLKTLASGLDYSVPSTLVGWQMTGATSFQFFITYIFAAIAAFGLAAVTLKSARDDSARWFADSFDGFRRPLGLAWFLLVLNVRITLWSFLFIIPGIIAMYRYRQAWYYKVEDPSRSASECLRLSSALMKGHKYQAFSLDCSYALWLLLPIIALVWAEVNAAVGEAPRWSEIGLMIYGLFLLWVVPYTLCHYFTARALFYEALRKDVKPSANGD